MDLVTRIARSATALSGPLLRAAPAVRAGLAETVTIRPRAGAGEARRGQIIELSEDELVIQVLETTDGLAPSAVEIVLDGEVPALAVGQGMLGRTFDGLGRPLDGLPPILAEARLPITGMAMNPQRRRTPSDMIETGISAIDGLNTLVRGQKLPIFSGAGLPAAALATQIARGARVRGGEPFAIVFCAMGAPSHEAEQYLRAFSGSEAEARTVIFLNLAGDPTIERLLAPRCALTAAEFLAFERGMHVLVILTDMTTYCDALREVALARDEIPGRRGYPGYMYTDLASIYERAGVLAERRGSVTQLPILTMPDDDITHPVPDLTGYVTEGQIVLSRELHRKHTFPPIDVLPSLSRLMNLGIGAERTRADHRAVANQLYALYARGRDIRKMAAIVGMESLGGDERRALDFADRFEHDLVHQGATRRSIEETLDRSWRLLDGFPAEALTRLSPELLAQHRREPPGDQGTRDGSPPDHADEPARARG